MREYRGKLDISRSSMLVVYEQITGTLSLRDTDFGGLVVLAGFGKADLSFNPNSRRRFLGPG